MSSTDLVGAVPRVDLMPARAREARARKAAVRTWSWVALGALVVAVVAVLAAFAYQLFASAELLGEQTRTQTLLVETAQYQDVSSLRGEQAATTELLSTALTSDLDWAPLLGDITAALPAGVRLTAFSLTPPATAADPAAAPAATDAGSAAALTADPALTGLSGTLSFEADSAGLAGPTVTALRALPGVLAADAGSLTVAAETGASFEVPIVFDQSSYTQRFAAAPAEGSAP